MIFLFLFVVITLGVLLTYLYDSDASLPARVCAGSFIGLTAHGLLAYVCASWLGLTRTSVWLATLPLALSLFVLREAAARDRSRRDWAIFAADVKQVVTLRAGAKRYAALALCAAVATLFYFFFQRAMYETPEGLFTGVDNNYYDLTVHIGIISGFTDGENFPPIHPHFAGARMAYPFLVDFMVAALMVVGGVGMSAAMFAQNMIFSLALVGLLWRWAVKVTSADRAAAFVTLVLVLLNGGGVGWVMLIDEARTAKNGVLGLLSALPHNYTVLWGENWGEVLRFGNSLTTLFLPQRSFLLGLPIFLLVTIIWWQMFREGGAAEAGANKRMIAAGALAGLLPLAHAHSFLVLMGVGSCFALLTRRWRSWTIFFAVAGALAAPQILWITWGSSTHAKRFAEWHFGWMKNDLNFLLFWFYNTGLFIPLLLAALIAAIGGWKRVVPRVLLWCYLPFALCFVVANVLKLAPWEFDNIKVLFYWYLASAPLVALLLARLLRSRRVLWRGAALALVLSLTFTGVVDVWRVLSRSQEYSEYDRDGLDLTQLIREATPPNAVILNAPVHNHPVLLAGRRSTLGYAETVWTHGIDSDARRDEVIKIYEGVPDAERMLAALGVQYAVVGPAERELIPNLDEEFFGRYHLIGEAGAARLYEINPPAQ